MSDPRRPFGDTSDDQDLDREEMTDVSTDADALDALLNEIASPSRRPDARSGNGHDRPKSRVDDHDGTGDASLLATAAAFHRRMEAAQTRDTRAAGPDPQLWETIMSKTTTGSSAAATNPGTTLQATADHIHEADRTAPRRHVMNRQRIWNMATTVGLVAAILLMAFGAWRIAGSLGLPGGGDGSRPAQHFAMQPATPDGTPDVPAVTEPIATPAPTTNCDSAADIPVFNGVDESPWDGTAVLLTTTGDVVLTCPEEPKDTVLAHTSEHGSVAPLEWPGVVLVHGVDGDPENPRSRAISLITGDVAEFGAVRSERAQVGIQQAPGSPWLVGPAPNDPADVQILDMRTMQTGLLSEIAGTPLPAPAHRGWLLSTGGDGNTLVLGLLKSAHPTEGDATLVSTDLPGGILVLNGSLEPATWLSAPEDVAPVVGFDVSPDGRYVALHGAKGPMDKREHTWSVVRLDNGAEVARSATVTTGPEPAEGVWTSNGFAYVGGSALMLLPIDGDGGEEVVFIGDGPLTDLRVTTDASAVLADQEWGDDLATMVATMQTPTSYSVDITTGEATTFTGVDVSANTDPWPYPTRFLVTFDDTLDSRDTITYRVIDAVTGETVGTLDDVPLTESGYEGYPMLGPRSVVSSADGKTEVIAFDTQHIYLMQMVDGEPTVRQIASPEGLPSAYPLTAQMFISPDGTMLSLTAESDEARTRWLLPLDGEPDEWVAIENQTVYDDPGYIFFVPGTGS